MLCRTPPGGLFANLGIGFRWLAKRDILWLVVTMAAVNLSIGQLEAVLVTVFEQKGVSALISSGLLAVGLAASAAASALTPRILPSWSAERRILLSQLAVLGAMCLIAAPFVALTAVGYFVLSFATGYNNVVSITYRHNLVPVEIAGRVNSVIRMVITGAVPASGLLYAGASRLEGFAFWVPALVILVVAVTAWGVHSFRGVTTETVPIAQ